MRTLAMCVLLAACGSSGGPADTDAGATPDADLACTSAATVCVGGQVESFVDAPLNPEPTATSGLVVRIYDQSFFANPSAAPLVTLDIGRGGEFMSAALLRPSSGIFVAVTDDQMTADDRYAPTAVIIPLAPMQRAFGTAYYVESSVVDLWQSQIGAPPGCTTLRGCGMWIGEYHDLDDNPVTNVTPSRPGDEPNLANVFCFVGGRAYLAADDVTTDLGLCAIAPDVLETHSGHCAAGGCTCATGACSPIFPSLTSGSVPGVILIQTLRGT